MWGLSEDPQRWLRDLWTALYQHYFTPLLIPVPLQIPLPILQKVSSNKTGLERTGWYWGLRTKGANLVSIWAIFFYLKSLCYINQKNKIMTTRGLFLKDYGHLFLPVVVSHTILPSSPLYKIGPHQLLHSKYSIIQSFPGRVRIPLGLMVNSRFEKQKKWIQKGE